VSPRPRRLAAPVAVLAVVGAAFVVGDREPVTNPDPGAGSPSSASSGTPAPRIVSGEEFCAGFGSLVAAREKHLAAPAPETVQGIRAAVRELDELSAGAALSESARGGVEFLVEVMGGLPDDATAQDVVEADDIVDRQDGVEAEALAIYIGETCNRPPISNAR
jgi:hypothetical protein